MPSLSAKLNYIRAWQALPKFGLSFFVVRFVHSKREVSFHHNEAHRHLLTFQSNLGNSWHRPEPLDSYRHEHGRCPAHLVLCSHEVVACQLGGEEADRRVRRREARIRVPECRLQGAPRVHRRLHLPVDALEGAQPNAERKSIPQTDKWMDLSVALSIPSTLLPVTFLGDPHAHTQTPYVCISPHIL